MESNSIINQPVKKGPFCKAAIGYFAFLVMGLYFLMVRGLKTECLSYLGLAFIFDPFDQKVRWDNRPLYQKAWLLAHLILTFVVMFFAFFVK
jgi:hypothetical protein